MTNQRGYDPEITRERRDLTWLWVLAGLAGLILLGALLLPLLFGTNDPVTTTAPTTGQGTNQGTGTGATTAPQTVTFAELTANPSRYYGQVVTVQGQLTDIVNNRSFTMGNELLVISRDLLSNRADWPWNPTFTSSTPIRVTGTFRAFDQAQIERDLGTSLGGEVFQRWTGRPSLYATNVERLNP